MIRLDGRYSRLDILPEDTAVSEGIADSYCPTEAAVAERCDCPSHTLARLLAMSHKGPGGRDLRWLFGCIGPAKYAPEATDIGYNVSPRPLHKVSQVTGFSLNTESVRKSN